MKIIFVADPMCSWCYGFSKAMEKLVAAAPGLDVRVVMGGLAAGSTTVLDDAGKRFRLMHWSRVEQLSGVPFNREALMARQNFVYDTEPVCRAVVAARLIEPSLDLLKVLAAFQRAFYVDGADTTNGEALAQVGAAAIDAQGFKVDVAAFLEVWRSDDAKQAARDDFALTRQLGVSGFPSLFIEQDGKVSQLTSGYAPAAGIQETLSRLAA
jgi:putative protein-disulfide isomerase